MPSFFRSPYRYVYTGVKSGVCNEQGNLVSVELKYQGGFCNLMYIFTF
jgi:hypothetical protein